ncbi:RNA recognition motif domain containing protein [Trichostrongylus colubriformis]|uniref:RNA recognition motif domain containing protein n=1 Tax=Trichostrongylus colubriformis TaxID=6319 RepID=A0AAN8F9M6_TRICO
MDAKVLSRTLVTTSTPAKSYVPSQRYCTAPNVEIGESKTNLIINYLPQGMTQEEVRSLFSSVGEIESCKLVRDKMTGQSLGYGFVNYCREDDALKAVSSFNGLRLQNKTIKVSYARPSNENIKGSNLYVSGIPKSMTLNELEAIFRPFGQIITSRILSDNITGLSKGVGFVRFDKKEEAELAIQTLNGTVPAGCVDQITVKFANNPATNTAKSVLQELEAAQQVAASNLVPLSLLGAAAPLRSAIGPIHHAPLATKYRYSPLASTIPGTAVPAITAQATADYLTTMLQMSQMNAFAGMAAATAPAATQLAALTPTAPATEPTGFCLFAYNLGPDTEDSLLWQLFGPFGAVLSVKVIRDFATTKCKGYAFVTMMNYADACNAIAALNGTQIAGRSLQVTFKAASAASSLI